ncbi:MAG: SpoIIE family protein phosphatase [Treponema sp.]|nr:SpoIIE family protein phosphatase [Treponema sp.]
MNKKMNCKIRSISKILLCLFFILQPLFASDFYWENPAPITKTDSRFPSVLQLDNSALVFWEEIDITKRELYLSARNYYGPKNYRESLRFAGPIPFSGDAIPDIYSTAVSSDGTIVVLVGANEKFLYVYTSKDDGQSFQESKLETPFPMLGPRLYTSSNGNLKLFSSVGDEESFSIYTAESKDGLNWSRFTKFQPAENLRNSFSPFLLADSQGDIVVFQAQYASAETGHYSYQLYMTRQLSNSSWTAPVLITNEASLTSKSRKAYYNYQNQRPYLHSFDGNSYIAWERTGGNYSEIWCAELDLANSSIKKGSSQLVADKGNSNRALLFTYNNSLYLEWFDSRRGKDSVYLSKMTGGFWDESPLAEDRYLNTFSYPMIFSDGSLAFIWQQSLDSGKKNSVVILLPDTSVLPPSFTPLSYKRGAASRNQNVKIRINFPEDSSKIAGYSYSWQKDSSLAPEYSIQHFTNDSTIKVKATEDGTYYLTARVVDYAGNWSEAASITYDLDLTPPLPPIVEPANLDKYGFVKSNTFSLDWQPSPSEDAASYSYRLDYLGDIPKNIAVSRNHPMKLSSAKVAAIKESLENKYAKSAAKKRSYSLSQRAKGRNTKKYYGMENGVYVLTVWALDLVGNVSEQASKIVILNKFQPETYVTGIEQKKAETGELLLTIKGAGFTYDGRISRIYIDRDGLEPYDYTISEQDSAFKILNNKTISGVVVPPEVEPASYKIGLFHTDRGLYFTDRILNITQNGTVKVEAPYQLDFGLSSNFKIYNYNLSANLIMTLLVIFFAILILIFLILSVIHAGVLMAPSKKRVKQPSLKRKLIRYTYLLIVFLIVAITIQNGRNVIKIQSQTMAEALQERVDVLLESLCSGVRNFLPSNNILELTALPSQKDAMDEVKYITIIGQEQKSSSSENLNYIWATNDPDISEKSDNYSLIYGQTRLTDQVILNIISGLTALDQEIAQKEKSISDQIEELSAQANKLYASALSEDQVEAERLSNIIVELRNKIDKELSEYSKNAAASYPFFDFSMGNTEFIFYRPVVYRKGNTDNYIHGLVYLELSTQSVVDALQAEIKRIIIRSIIIALIAVAIGIFGSYVFASLIVRPIKKLEAHVTLIGQTKNKANLKGKNVEITSKDEIGRLGNAVNNMTRELVANAEEESLVMDGKAVQMAFLPLSSAGPGGREKTSYAQYKDQNLECFGYYEGESGVSGDYFDYKKLDDQWFVIIKCDASGHGIPAAIIMTVVATIFRRYFEKWSYKKNGARFNDLIAQINDFIEGLGLKGKFATLIVCLLNVENGDLYMCNAGDNLVHIYDAESRAMKQLTLSSAPTAGVFTSGLVDMKGGFKIEKTVLNHGDVLYLYTDGIEESTRRRRNPDYSVIKEEVQARKVNPKTHEEEIEIKEEDSKEEFGPERVKAIIEAVYNKQPYELVKDANPDLNEKLIFDFSKGQGSVEDSIYALASIEKVFRLYRSPAVQATDYIKVDKKIDECLLKYFNEYELYAAKKSDNAQGGHYVDYDQMQEDEQSDDLTLLAIKRI